MTNTQHLIKMQFDLADMRAKLKTLTAPGAKAEARRLRSVITSLEANIRNAELLYSALARSRARGEKNLIRIL